MIRVWLAVAVGWLAALPAVGQEANREIAAEARRVLKTYCHRCHSGDGSSSGYAFDVARHGSLTEKIGDDEAVVVPHSLEKSPLWAAIQKRMPLKGTPEREKFGDAEREVIRRWIVAGAPAFPTSEPRPFRSLRAELQAIRDHLMRAERSRRPYLRYFTLANQHNNGHVDEEDLRYLRAALSKVLNSLSWKPRIVVPEAVDGSGTVYAIDLRDLDWDAQDQWRRLVEVYPYGLKYGSHPDESLRELDREIVRETGVQLAVLRADWFVATASRPPLYHDLLELPRNARDLERRLGVNIPANFAADKLMRAGFAKSGVSGQNRMVERHDATYGAYWKSYDFFPETGRAQLTRFPLGPLFERHPFPEHAFKHDGGEIIFHLPNGMQGYLLVNNQDDRIDAGPIDIVADDKRVSGTPAIVNGISCMACHSHGVIWFKDEIRSGHALGGAAGEKVKRLYPDAGVWEEVLKRDQQRFLAALDQAIGPFLKVGDHQGKPITDRVFEEPVAKVVVPYRRGYLDLPTVAAELYLDKPEAVLQVGARRLRELGLESLTKQGGLIGRFYWEAVDGNSLMQELAEELGFTPFGRAVNR